MSLPYRNPYRELNHFNSPMYIKTLISLSNIYNYHKKYNFIKITNTEYNIRINCSIIDYLKIYGNQECISLKIKEL